MIFWLPDHAGVCGIWGHEPSLAIAGVWGHEPNLTIAAGALVGAGDTSLELPESVPLQ